MIKKTILYIFLCLTLSAQSQDTTIYLNFHTKGKANVRITPFKHIAIYSLDREKDKYVKGPNITCFGEFSVYRDSMNTVTNYKIYYRLNNGHEFNRYYDVKFSSGNRRGTQDLVVKGYSDEYGRAKFVVPEKERFVKYYHTYNENYEEYEFFVLIEIE
jgi:hypothetical protein